MGTEVLKKIVMGISTLLLFFTLLVLASQFSQLNVGVVHVDPIVNKALSPNLLSGGIIGLNGEKKIPVIITFKDEEKIKEQQKKVLDTLSIGEERSAEGVRQNLAEDKDLIIKHKYETINALAGELTASGLAKLEKNPEVEGIYYDYPLSLFLDDSVPLVKAALVHSLSARGKKIKGAGETICVIDTGIDYTHLAFGGCSSADFINGSCSKVISGYDVADADNDPRDLHGHGSHIAGIAASVNETYLGVAPEAKLVALKVFPGSSSTTNVSNVIAGIDWCKSNAAIYNISVITLSLGDGSQRNSYCDEDVLSAAANSAVDAGIFVDVASGNNGYSSGVGIPACASKTIAVGWTDKNDNIAAGSNSGLTLDLLAPGSGITSVQAGGRFTAMSGTSMSAPHVAGAAALLIQYWKLAYNETLTPKQVGDRLKLRGQLLNDSRNGLYFPRLDVLAAVQPYLSFTEKSVENNFFALLPHVYLEISSDLPLSAAWLEWNYDDGSRSNFTLQEINNTLFFYNMTNLVPGLYTYKVYGNDSVNTIAVSSERTLTVDNIAPAVSITNPANGTVLRESQLFSAKVTDLSSVEQVIFKFSNGSSEGGKGDKGGKSFSLAGEKINDSWQTVVNTERFVEGLQKVTIFANDTLGNVNASESLNFIVDRTVPLLFALARTPNDPVTSDDLTFSLNVTDLNLNRSAIFLETNLSGELRNYTLIPETGNRYNYTLSSGLTSKGVFSYRFLVSDLAGNLNSSEKLELEIHNSAPQAAIFLPVNGTVVEIGTSIQFVGNGSDADNDPLTYSWDFEGYSAAGASYTHLYNTTGAFRAILNVSDYWNESLAFLTVLVNDTQPPNLTSVTYDSNLHLEQDGQQQVVTAVVFDYSGISNVTLMIATMLYPANCSPAGTSWSCSWNLENLPMGEVKFTLSSKDNFTTPNTFSETYSFSVTSCSDGSQNGDESGIDCGGSCTVSCPSSDSTGGSSGGGSGGGSSSGIESNSITAAAVTESGLNNRDDDQDESIKETSEPAAEEIAAEAGEESEASANPRIDENRSLGQIITGAIVSLASGKLSKKWYALLGFAILTITLLATVYSLQQKKGPNFLNRKKEQDDYI